MKKAAKKKRRKRPPWKVRVMNRHKIIVGLWSRALQHICKLADDFAGNRFRIVMFGSALLPEGSFARNDSAEIGRWCDAIGSDRADGGGGGTMTEFVKKREVSHGANIGEETFTVRFPMDLPDIERNDLPDTTVLDVCDFALRLIYFGIWGNAYVVLPGGIGTNLEVAWVLQMVQKIKLAKEKGLLNKFRFLHNPAARMGLLPPLIIINPKVPGTNERYFDGLKKQLRMMDRVGALNPGDIDLVHFVNDVAGAKILIRKHIIRWVRFCQKHKIPIQHQAAKRVVWMKKELALAA